MQTMTPKGMQLLLGATLVMLPQAGWAQKASNWRVYKLADGLPESTCTSVTIAPHGKVLVRHLNVSSVSELDGYTVSVLPAPDAGNGRVYESPGGQLWTVVRDGLQEFKNGAWIFHPVAEIAAEMRAAVPRPFDPVPLCPIRQGLVAFLLPDRLLEFNAENPNNPGTRVLGSAAKTRLGHFSGFTLARDGGLWLAGGRGLAKLSGPLRNPKPEDQWQEFIAPEALAIRNLQELHEDPDGGLTAVAESTTTHQKLVVYFDGRNWSSKPAGSEKIRLGWRDTERTWWAAATDVLFQWEAVRPEMVENEDIAARRYYDLAIESGGAFWLATSEGLFRYSPLTWSTPGPARNWNSLVHCLTGDQDGQLWFVTSGGLHVLRESGHQEFPFPAAIARTAQSTRALFSLKDGTLLLNAGGQLFRFQPADGSFSSVEYRETPVRRWNALGTLKDGNLCVQSFVPDVADPDHRLESFDGIKFVALSEAPPAPLLSASLSTLFLARNGDLWLGGDEVVSWCHDNKWKVFASSDKTTPDSTSGFAELADGRIWCAAHDKIWEFDGRNWSTQRGGFDRINAMIRAHDGSIWVASNNGLYRFFQGAWIENGIEEGLPSLGVREIYEDQRGHVWAGTTHGLSLYHPEADPDPPQAYIQTDSIHGNSFPDGGPIVLTFTGRDKWKYTPRDRLLYSYRLDDRDWSAFAEANTVSFTDLPAGKHYFRVRAMDRNANVTGQGPQDPKPAQIEFSVVLPWYKETRLVLISLSTLTVALFFAALAFNRHRQLVRSYAEVEQKVAQRTQELEVAHRELLHSQKMNALGTLAAGIAHDFNNILSIIKGSAQLIEDNLGDPQKIRVRADRIKTVVEQGAGIVKAMLGFGRESDPEPALCDLNEVVEDTIKLLGDRFLREVQVNFQPAPNIPEVPAARDFVQQILLNFIFNAAESMTGRKQIILATRRLEHPPPALPLAPARASAYVCISVQDFGSGILPENLPRIFEPFFTTKALSTRRGTGLGLTMAYELARKMQAGLAVDSTAGHGSTFALILPVQEVKPQTKVAKPKKLEAAS